MCGSASRRPERPQQHLSVPGLRKGARLPRNPKKNLRPRELLLWMRPKHSLANARTAT